MKQWLLEIRNNSGQVGHIALEGMETRSRRWRARREKDPLIRMSRVGSAVELVTHEKNECKRISSLSLHWNLNNSLVDVLNTDELKIDFKPLFECIHIYTALDSLDELRRSYQADRKVGSEIIAIMYMLMHIEGAIRPHSPQPAPNRFLTNFDARNIRLLHCRKSRTRNDRLVPF